MLKIDSNYQQQQQQNHQTIAQMRISMLCTLHIVIEFMIPIEDNEKMLLSRNVTNFNVYVKHNLIDYTHVVSKFNTSAAKRANASKIIFILNVSRSYS